jgi:hypothetical protein
VLYERGEGALEPVVRDLLRELGAEVRDPTVRGQNDGTFSVPNAGNGVLEIKRRTGPIRLGDVRQLQQWVTDLIAEADWEGRGILVANAHCDLAPDARPDPFPDNCIRFAERMGLCLVTTTDLFGVLRQHQHGQLDLEEFWSKVMSTSGVAKLEPNA